MNNRALSFFGITWLVSGLIYWLGFYTKGEWVLWFCDNFNPLLYKIFSFVTRLGEPVLIIIVIFIIALFHYRYALYVFSSWLLASLITIALKGLIANNRPAFYYESNFLECAGDIPLWYGLSTPSGHTTAAFAFFIALALIVRKTIWQWFFFFLAWLVGMSRIILFMHYYFDVYLGAVIGIITSFGLFLLFQKYDESAFTWNEKKGIKDQWKNS